MKIRWRHPIRSVKDRFFEMLTNEREAAELRFTAMAKEIAKNKSHIHSLAGRPVNIVFVCHRPAIWPYLQALCDTCIEDPAFQVTIIPIPNKKQLPGIGLNHNIFETEGAEEFFMDYPCLVINGYDYLKQTWLDLKSLNPDYLFFQTPYNICRPPQYHAKVVSGYTQLCYVHYGLSMLSRENVIKCHAKEFIQYTSFVFAETPFHRDEYIEALSFCFPYYDNNRIFLTGSARLETSHLLTDMDSTLWRHPRSEKYFRILWTPRWSETENNCTFRTYLDFLYEIAESSHFDLVFRPHPQAFLSYIAEGIQTPVEQEQMVQKFQQSRNCQIDRSFNSLDAIRSADVLITDPSGLFFEYFLTGKPVIYCEKNNDWGNDFALKLFLEGAYRVHNHQELIQVLQMLVSGNDPLKEKRKELIHSEFFFPPENVATKIKNILKKHYERLE